MREKGSAGAGGREYCPGDFDAVAGGGQTMQEIIFREFGFRNSLFLKSGSLFFRLASVIFQPSQQARHQTKDGITKI
ncbi:hypothetical protein EFV37_06750 [Mesorhizobium loti]|uniref:Uncharacterized protein n=1 Tax=Mesorhizobium jarvisii TaxID=1777867 RepID=A0A6M7TAA9_9HYPH|nr:MULTISPECIES: hypothetical protein [Mesorhizobium]OBQ76597.1 hypothetical protein A9K72_06185 [Mesorhizobium loti]QKC62031.1 hypothetical protein EB229_06745 [Mesorhizobium jarvisii]QKD07942.1 hypothetical protein EFV37_06750 [Mesorhizobium loti]RJT35721.1 hypothetical protein D3242_09725 [Mesorhizobium jarvisii]